MTRKLLIAGCSALAFALTSPAIAQDTSEETIAAAEAADWGAFGVQTQYMDTSVEPGDDFDAYVNGEWIKTTEIPADKTSYGAFNLLGDLSEARVHMILKELAAGTWEAGSDEARLANAYAAFMDTDAIDAAGLAPAQPYLQTIYAAKTPADLVKLFATPGYASPIAPAVFADMKNSDVNAIYFFTSGLGLPDRDYYLKPTATNLEAQAEYKKYLAFLLGKAGYQNPEEAARAVYSLEVRMAQEDWSQEVSRQRDLTYTRLEANELAELGPDGLMTRFLADMGLGDLPYAVVWQMPPTQEELDAAGIDAAEAAANIGGGVPAVLDMLETVPVSTWQAWLAAKFLSSHSEVLPTDIADARFDFYGRTLRGQEEQRPRWKRGIDAVEGQMGELLGKIYTERYYSVEEKAKMEALVANLRTAMDANLDDLTWMSADTKVEAKAKLNAFMPKIGSPDEFETYEGLMPTSNDPLANAMMASQWAFADEIKKVGQEVDRGEWGMFPQTVNAYYNPTLNEIVFPAAILQPPFFNVEADPAVNYGAIGAVIGHEMGHGFDDQGAKSDGEGNLRNWWTDGDKANFEKLQDALAAQYDAFCPFDNGETCVNGRLTMGENIGDLGGLSLAYRAYRLSLNGEEAPVIDGYTGDQRFFMSWAQVWRSKMREKRMRELLVTDPHSPPHYRINGIVRNFDEWYKAFDVKPGDDLYLPPDERVRIW